MKVAGVVILFNPTKEEIENINFYIDDIDVLYAVDNSDIDNKELLPDNKKIIYMPNYENLGMATALNIGARRAIDEKYNFLLTMDQDSKFTKDSIVKMKEFIEGNDCQNIAIITPRHDINDGESFESERAIDYPLEVMTSGNILNLDIYQKLGGFKEWLFIDGVDIEYCLNANLSGYKIARLNYVKMIHNLGDLKYSKIFNRKFIFSNHSPIRRYYITRNNAYIKQMYRNYYPLYCSALANIKSVILSVLLFENKKFKKIKYILKGRNDFKNGIKGKYKY